MNKLFFVICAATLSVSLLPSCTTSGGGETIRYPTVSQMEDLERQWGLPPRTVKRLRDPQTGEYVTPAPSSAPAPVPLAPAPVQGGAAPAPTQPAVDPATLQKLR